MREETIWDRLLGFTAITVAVFVLFRLAPFEQAVAVMLTMIIFYQTSNK